MALQTSVAFDQGMGKVGTFFDQSIKRTQTGIVKGTAANIVVGRAFTIDTSDGKFSPGGTGAFGGILLDSGIALRGDSTGTLAPSLTVPAGEVCEFATMGRVIVQLTNAATIESGVYFVNADGTLGAGTATTGQTQIANAKVKFFTNAAAGLAVISLTGD
jgi:hypothetical protein